MDSDTMPAADLRERLQKLEEEYEKGQKMLRETELQRAQLEQTLIRIEGAMTVLRELLDGSPNGAAGLVAEGD